MASRNCPALVVTVYICLLTMLVGDQKPKQKQKQKQQPWRISVHAKANNFDFKFMAATNILAVWGSSRLSLLFRLRAFALKVKSESKASTPKKRKSLKSKFLRFLGKFQPRSSKNKVAAPPETKTPLNHLTRFACEEPVCVSSLVIGGIALIFRWISEICCIDGFLKCV
ncbi:uncharacterized protein LOC131159739 isoform X2 [Malania oleifera]|uniref:uncharacterized protein LOC131159739 isoform X2 n=1 Tax=Malania oleifera TaxID=397392 RepID=UPI0025AE4DED|nr:uncharacterized protein LOC131159739 isoform X2 [Malania oleifera]